MRAVQYTQYGPPGVLEVRDVPTPIPGDTQVLVRVLAASVNALDWRPLTFPPLILRLMGGGRRKPRDPSYGVDLAGVVESVGVSVTQFKAGDEVFGVGRGAFAEYACAEARKIALKPASVPFDLAAATPVAGCTALQALRDKGGIRPGQEVLVHGASGGVGTFAVQLARSFDARVTALCSGRNVDLARSNGADEVIDYSREEFAGRARRYDLILAVNGNRPLRHYRRALKPAGVCVFVGGSFGQILPALVLGPLLSRMGTKKMRFMMARSNHQDLAFLAHLLEAGSIRPLIDRRYPLTEVPDAMRYLIDEHPRGKVIVLP